MWTRIRRVVAGSLGQRVRVRGRGLCASGTFPVVAFVTGQLRLLRPIGELQVFQPVPVSGVENVKIEGVHSHVQWRGMVGKALTTCEVRDLDMDEVHLQERQVAKLLKEEENESVDAEVEKKLMEDDSQ